MTAEPQRAEPAEVRRLREAYHKLLQTVGWPPTSGRNPDGARGEIVIAVAPEQYGWLSGPC